ncbi:MAG: hypothetical protein MZV70_17955 [Desulfobacterales bacterium]|nr:hypothetical protein [Desulfobacterales bacterium]
MSENTDRTRSVISTVVRLAVGIPMIGALFFLPAGTFNYWQAWVWLGALFIPMGISLVYLVRMDPALLERRARTNEMRPEQRRIIMASTIYLLTIFILPGFDVRYGWSNVPAWLCSRADGVVLGSYTHLCARPENQYLCRRRHRSGTGTAGHRERSVRLRPPPDVPGDDPDDDRHPAGAGLVLGNDPICAVYPAVSRPRQKRRGTAADGTQRVSRIHPKSTLSAFPQEFGNGKGTQRPRRERDQTPARVCGLCRKARAGSWMRRGTPDLALRLRILPDRWVGSRPKCLARRGSTAHPT